MRSILVSIMLPRPCSLSFYFRSCSIRSVRALRLTFVCTSPLQWLANIFGPKNGLNLEYMNEANPGSSVPFRYGHFKLAALFFAQSLAERYPSVVTMAAHSGAARVSLGTKSPLHDSQRSGRLRDICFGRSKGGLPSTKSTGL